MTTLSDVLLGCALGDAWGRALERKSIDTILFENGRYGAGLPDGELFITDDTQMSR